MTNLIIIDCHDIGQHLGAYGRKTSPTKNLDALASKGIRFENSFGTAPQCSPSRSGLYTGRYPHANGMFGLAHHPFNWRLHPNERHLATQLLEKGFDTTLIGIQHVTSHNTELIKDLGYQNFWALHKPQDVAEKATQFLTNNPPKPFFLKIGFEYPHRDENGRFKQAPPDSSLGVEVPPYLPQTFEAKLEFAELQGVIKEMDEAVGQIWSALTQSGLLKDTWLIFTTDHGIAMPFAKCTLYDRGIETALIMYAEPFGLVGGRVITDLISNVDLVPTILEMLDLDTPENLQGRSFVNLLRQQPYHSREEIYAEKTFHTAYEPQRAIRTTRYKLIWNVEAGIINVPGDVMRSPIYPQVINQVVEERPTFELYDLQDDPLERKNLIDNSHYQDVFTDLRQRLLKWMKDTQDPILQGPLASPFYDRGRNLLLEPGDK
jgi:N-sulfoglucosamine sulfohydrolase